MDDQQKFCEHRKCGKPIAGTARKKYCNDRCRTRECSSKRYELLKNNPGYIESRKAYYAEWLKNNRSKFNEKMRIISRNWRERNKESLKIKYQENRKKLGKELRSEVIN